LSPQQRTRVIRRGLLALALAVVAAVALSLKHPPASAPAATPTASAPPGATTAEELVYRRIVDGKERGIVRAKAMVGQDKEGTRLRGVDATFGHLYEGKEGSTRIVADDCLYDAEKQKASFHGNVVVTTSEGLELRSPSLVYNGAKELVKSDEAVEFAKGNVSGRSVGMEYEAKAGQLSLREEVFIRIAHDEGPATEIKSGSAKASKVEATMVFVGGVEITRGAEALKAQKLKLNLSPDLAFVYRAVAIDDMELTTAGATPSEGGRPSGGDGPRVLRGRKLDAWFDETTHKIRQALAGPEASLSIAGPKGGDDRALTARFIDLRFDGEGRLAEIYGLKDAVLVSTPRNQGKGGGARTVRCFTLIGRMAPATGAMVSMDFQSGVDIVEPKRHATAQSGHYEEAGQVLSLLGEARVLDEGQASDLRADGIELRGKSGDVSARENVRHQVTPRTKSGPFGGDRPDRVWQMTSRLFDYDAATKTGRYQEKALLRAGDDEVRAPVIVIEESRPGQRKLTASGGGVASVLHPKNDGKEKAERKEGRKPIETRSEGMVYEEAKSTVVYRGDVEIRQGDITTKSPEATAFLGPDGSRVKTVVAGEPVDVRQGERRAHGTRGTYTPESETLLLVGDKVVLEDPKQKVQGRSLTFRSGDDTILVDGRDVERTESVFRRDPSPP
jgi:LPS export ABC transporter protein LptC/lipopolysaccharide transport protein LptA